MHANRYSLKLFGILGAVFFAAAPASAQCIDQWLPGEGLPGLNGDVGAVAVYDDGTSPALYVGGEFSVVGNVLASNIAKWDGTQWQPLGSGMNDEVRALTVYNGELIAGGEFNTAGGKEANYIARWDGTSWSPLGSGVSSHVNALTVYNGELIAGGWFHTAGGTPAIHIARWDGTIWSPLGSGIQGGQYVSVSALTVYKGELIAGGNFTTAGGTAANHIARWNGQTWSPLGSGINARVYTLTVYNGELIAGGLFSSAGGTAANSIARWDGATWSPLGSGMNSRVYALTAYNGELFAGGWFTTAGGMEANYIARWDPGAPGGWSSLGNGMNDRVYALTVYNGELVAGGDFLLADGSAANHIARWDPGAPVPWQALGSGISSGVGALMEYNGELVVGGYFTTAGGTPASKIARWDGATWSPLGSGMQGCQGKYCSSSAVHALTIYNGELIAGGNFLTAGGTEANSIARWDGTTWSPLGSGMGGGYYYTGVRTLTEYNGELIAGGYFTIAGGTPVNLIARWDGTNWSPLGSGITGGFHTCPPYVAALAVYKGELIAGGEFSTAGGTEVNTIARWDGTTWSPLGDGMGAGFSNISVQALTVYNGELIAGGLFTAAGGTESNFIARWDGSTWSPLGSGMNSTVYALSVYNGELIAGGRFTTAGGTEANRIARWDPGVPGQWSPLGSGMGGGFYYPDVRTLTEYNGELIAGGYFSIAGENVSAYWARWGPDVPLGDLDGDCTVGVPDLLLLLGNWGPCADCKLPGDCPADLDGDCTVGVKDLLILLGNWG